MTGALIGFGVLVLLSFIPLGWVSLRAYRRFKEARVVTCPKTGQAAAVQVDRGHAAASAAHGETDLRLTSCSEWPAHESCGQECLSQIEAAPEGCLARNIARDWYQGADCALCGQPVRMSRSEKQPGLLTPDRRAIEWRSVRPVDLPGVLATHKPVCWNCLVAQASREQFPGRPATRPGVRRAS